MNFGTCRPSHTSFLRVSWQKSISKVYVPWLNQFKKIKTCLIYDQIDFWFWYFTNLIYFFFIFFCNYRAIWSCYITVKVKDKHHMILTWGARHCDVSSICLLHCVWSVQPDSGRHQAPTGTAALKCSSHYSHVKYYWNQYEMFDLILRTI